jgi:hypothetical protein
LEKVSSLHTAATTSMLTVDVEEVRLADIEAGIGANNLFVPYFFA